MNSDLITEKIDVLTSGFNSIEEILQPPFHYRDHGNIETYRFGKPGVLHFVVVHFGQILSYWSAINLLQKSGFQHQIMTLYRSIFEAENKIGFVLSGEDGSNLGKKQRRYLEKYFADNQRQEGMSLTSNTTPHSQIIDGHSDSIKKDIQNLQDWGLHNPNAFDSEVSSTLKNLYKIGSYYTHGRYPELMSFYEGDIPKFSHQGLKDSISVDTMDELIEFTLTHSIKTLVTSIFKLLPSNTIPKYSDAVKWALFDSGIDTEEIRLLRKVWKPPKP